MVFALADLRFDLFETDHRETGKVFAKRVDRVQQIFGRRTSRSMLELLLRIRKTCFTQVI